MARNILTGIILLLATTGAFLLLSDRYALQYQAGHALVAATYQLDQGAREKAAANTQYLNQIEQQIGYAFTSSKDSVRTHPLYRKSRRLHESSFILFNVLQADSALAIGHTGTNAMYTLLRQTGNRMYTADIFAGEHHTTAKHALRVQQQLGAFLAETAGFPKTATSEKRYSRLKALASLEAEDFYRHLYNSPKAYLVLARIAVIRSEIAAIEEECLSKMLSKAKGLRLSGRNRTWVPYTVTAKSKASHQHQAISAAIVPAGDTLHLHVKLLSPLKLYKASFAFPGGTIDSIPDNSAAYVTYPKAMPPRSGNGAALPAQQNLFGIKVNIPGSGRDTTFFGRFSKQIRTIKNQVK